jgi:hypothetical protein
MINTQLFTRGFGSKHINGRDPENDEKMALKSEKTLLKILPP